MHSMSSSRERPAKVIPMTTVSVEEPEKSDDGSLSAVEKFLRDTDEYEVVSAPPAEAASPMGQVASASSVAQNSDGKAPAVNPTPAPTPNAVVTNAQVTLDGSPLKNPELAIPAIQSVNIRPVAGGENTAARPELASTANQPLGMESGSVEPSLDRLVEKLREEAGKGGDFDAEWKLRLVELAMNRSADPAEYSPKLAPDARGILAAFMKAGEAVRQAARNPLDFGEEALQRVSGLQKTLADRADPIVAAVALCRTVITFGVYEEMPQSEFVAGRSIRTIVYSEIENLRSEMSPEGQYRTSLGTRIAVLTEDGKEMWEHEEPEIVDVCRRRRSDFFVAQRVTLPPTLAAGEYVLKVLVEDRLSGKANESAMRFTVHSPTSVAASQ
jgi:hypothetical protein